MLTISFGIILFYICERLLELVVNVRNRKILQKDHTFRVLNPNESMQMKLFHGFWFVMLLVESSFYGKVLEGNYFIAVAVVLVLAQILRWVSIFTLGKFWSVDVYEMEGHAVINKGPYSFIKHPNYLAVAIEFIFVPLLLGCPVTLVVGAVIKYFILKRRIRMEEGALNRGGSEYDEKFVGKKRFLPG
jgi:methyltransferase